MRKRVIVGAIFVAMLGAAYAAGAATPSTLTSLSGHRLRALVAVRESDPQTFSVYDQPHAPTPLPGARLVLHVAVGEQGIFDIRFSPYVTSNGTGVPYGGEILVDGTAVPPIGWPMFLQTYPIPSERVTGPLSPGTHVVTVVATSARTGSGSSAITLDGWTLVAEQVKAK